jgi:Bacterial regulatory proteins, tetR family
MTLSEWLGASSVTRMDPSLGFKSSFGADCLRRGRGQVAILGVSAPTAKIANGAGVPEGTLFIYFANKDELLNRLYLELKMDLRDAMMTGYPTGNNSHSKSGSVSIF